MASRVDRAAEVAGLAAEGLNGPQIAKRLGISQSWASELLTDPDGLKIRARKASYGKPCAECGTVTDGSRGSSKAPDLCIACHNRERHWQCVKRIITGIRGFHHRYGRLPAAADFNPANARARGDHWRAERFYRDGDYPFSSEVVEAFGSWNAGITAAGFEPLQTGRYERLPGRQGTGDPTGAHLADERSANAR